MLAYAQLLVTRSRERVGQYFSTSNLLLVSYLQLFVASVGIFVLGSFMNRDICLTVVRGQDKMTSKYRFGYGDPSKVKQSNQNIRYENTHGRGFTRGRFLKGGPNIFLITKMQEVVQLLKQDVVMSLTFKLNAQEQVGNLI